MLKKIYYIVFMLLGVVSWACPACEKQQPEMLQGITHGTGPSGNSDYFIIGAVAFIVLLTFVFFIKYTFFPKEKSVKHIKRKILSYGQ